MEENKKTQIIVNPKMQSVLENVNSIEYSIAVERGENPDLIRKTHAFKKGFDYIDFLTDIYSPKEIKEFIDGLNESFKYKKEQFEKQTMYLQMEQKHFEEVGKKLEQDIPDELPLPKGRSFLASSG